VTFKNIASNKNNHQQAIQNYNQTIELDPKYAGAFNNRGIVHRKLGKEEKAIESWMAFSNCFNLA
jgi:tetratricopeptide (TPR) repeat protein